jgi:hypothetical protein
MDLVPENLDGAVVFNVINSCGANKSICGNCADFAVGVHNWLMNTDVRYVLVDLQDEKEICPTFLEELLQLARRLRIPFLFAGVMDKAKRVLLSYNFQSRAPLFVTPEDAVTWLDQNHPGLRRVSLHGMQFGVPVASSRPRNAVMAEVEAGEPEAAE